MQDIFIYDFDASVSAQSELVAKYQPRIKRIDLQRHQFAARLWSSSIKFNSLRKEIATYGRPFFALLGSGDFHHFSLALIEQHEKPLTVVLFDNHPDWMKPPHRYHCGTWVYSLARLQQVKRVVIIGLQSGDIDGKNFLGGDIESYANGKIKLLPFTKVEAQISSHAEAKTEPLSSQLETNIAEGIREIMAAITTHDVYISVDKDCLHPDDACTNWEQGTMPLATVLRCIAAIRTKYKVVGADTVGDYSKPAFRSPFKYISSRLDRRGNAKSFQPSSVLLQRNQVANLKLIQAFDGNT
jgi:arginase family enzyme